MKRLINLVLILAIVAAVIASFAYLGLDLEELGSATSLKQMGLYVARFLSPDLSADYLTAILRGSMETLAIRILFSHRYKQYASNCGARFGSVP